MTNGRFRKIVVYGVGLIGGSFALALRRADAVDEVVGFGRRMATLEQAKHLGIIDRIGVSEKDELGDADLVLLATPVGQMAELMARITPHLGAHTLVTDGGSTKSDVVRDAYAHMGSRVGQFVPAHPIAGAELSGPSAAGADLYVNKKVILTPLPENSPAAVEEVRNAWQICGATIHLLSHEQHDAVFAAVSHLPHLLSFALVHDLSQRDDCDLLMSFAASGFRDFTRIAASSPEMWRDICIANRHALLGELDAYMAELMRARVLLAGADAEGLAEMFDLARTRRDAWLASLDTP